MRRPTAGAIMKPWPTKPLIWSRPATPGVSPMTGESGHGGAPGAGGDHHPVRRDAPAIRLHRPDAAFAHLDSGRAGEGLHQGATLARAVGVAPEEGPGEHHAVLRIPGGGDELRGVELRHDLARLPRPDHAGGEAVPLLQICAVLDPPQRLLVVGEEQVSSLAQPDVDPQLLGKAAHELDRLLRQLDQRRRGPLGPDAAAVPARGSLAQVAALEDQDAPCTAPRQVPRQREPHDPAPDDRHVHPVRQRSLRLERVRSLAPGGAQAGGRDARAGHLARQAGIGGQGGGHERRAGAKRDLRLGRNRLALRADAHRRHLAALALAGAGAQAGVALEALDVGEAVRDRVVDVVDADVLAGADDRFLAQRHAALPAISPEGTAGLPATVPAANSQGTLVRPSWSVSTGKPLPSNRALAPAQLASSCKGAGGSAIATASQRMRVPSAASRALTGLPRARLGTPLTRTTS